MKSEARAVARRARRSSTGRSRWATQTLTRAELQALAAAEGAAGARPRPVGAGRRAEEIQAALDVLEGARAATVTAREVIVRMALGAPADAAGPAASRACEADGLARRPAGAARRARRRIEELRAARGLHGHAAAVPGARATRGSRFLRPLGLRRLPGRRHGPGQDGPDARAASSSEREHGDGGPVAARLPDVGRRQLAAGGRALHARPAACWSTTAPAARRGDGVRDAGGRSTRSCSRATRCCTATSSTLRRGRLGRRRSSTRRRTSRTRETKQAQAARALHGRATASR